MSTRVLIVDDHQVLRVGLITLLGRDPNIQVVGEADDGTMAVELARRLRPGVVLMDIQLPGLNGVEATRRIVREMPDVKVIMFTMYRDENQALEALRLGAMGYLNKDANPNEILDAIRTVAEGKAVLAPELAARVLLTLHRTERPDDAQSEAKGVELTEREITLLRAVAQGMNNKQIAKQVGLSESRVRNQLSEIYSKLQVADRTQAAVYAVEKGIL